MPIASVVVEIQNGAGETVLGLLGAMREVSVFGMKENQIVTVIESSTPEAVEGILSRVRMIEDVVGVYPVYIGEDE